MNCLTSDIELRNVPIVNLELLAGVLETCDDWKILMLNIPKHLNGPAPDLKYSLHHVKIIEEAGVRTGRKCSEILFSEWGTSGEVRPNLNTLKQILLKLDMFRAADELCTLLNEPLPSRPKTGPAAHVITDLNILLKFNMPMLTELLSNNLTTNNNKTSSEIDYSAKSSSASFDESSS